MLWCHSRRDMVDSNYILELELIDGFGKIRKDGQLQLNPCMGNKAVGW